MKMQAIVPLDRLSDVSYQLDLDIDVEQYMGFKQVFITRDIDIKVDTELLPGADLVPLETFLEVLSTPTTPEDLIEILNQPGFGEWGPEERIYPAVEAAIGWEVKEKIGKEELGEGRWVVRTLFAYTLVNEKGEELHVGLEYNVGKTEEQPTTFEEAYLVEPYEVTVWRFRRA